MKKFVSILLISFLFSCKDDSSPIKTEPPNPYVQKEIDWPSLKKAPWPMYRHDPQLTGRTRQTGPVAGILADSISVGNYIASIVIDNDSTYFVSSTPGPMSKNLTKWKYDTTLLLGINFNVWKDTYNSPILTSSGDYYYTTPRKLYRLKNDTNIAWTYTPPAAIFTFGSTIDKSGNIYLKQTSPGGIIVLSPSGEQLFTLPAPPSTIHAASFSPDGNTIYVSASTLIAIDIPSRQIKWSADSIGIFTSPIVDSQGNIYFFAKNETNGSYRMFKSISPEGTTRWTYPYLTSASEHGIEPVVDWNGNVYCATDTVYSFTNDGKLRWKVGLETGERNYTSLTCDGTNTVYVLTTKNNIYAIASSGIVKWKLHIPNAWFSVSPSIADGKLFVPTVYVEKVYIIK